MNSTLPLVSVIIPTYNRADKVVAAVESVLGQAYRNIQLIVVDDGSNDGTRTLLANVPAVEYVYQENAGQAAARNTGLSYAKGDVIASLDSDDYWDSKFLEKCVDALLRYDADFVFANWNQKEKDTGQWSDFLSGDPYLKPFRESDQDGWFSLNDRDLRKLYLQACPSPSSSAVMKRASIVAGWNKELNIGDDWGLYLDMIFGKPCKAVFTMEKLWYKDIDGQNIFDGRERSEVVRLLLVEDTKAVMQKYQNRLTVEETKMLEHRYVEGLVELGKHVLVREGKFAESKRLFSEAWAISATGSLATLKKLLGYAINHRIRNIRQKLTSTSLLGSAVK